LIRRFCEPLIIRLLHWKACRRAERPKSLYKTPGIGNVPGGFISLPVLNADSVGSAKRLDRGWKGGSIEGDSTEDIRGSCRACRGRSRYDTMDARTWSPRVGPCTGRPTACTGRRHPGCTSTSPTGSGASAVRRGRRCGPTGKRCCASNRSEV